MIAIISDIHGNFVALSKVLEMIDQLGVTEIYCLGDVVGYYSQVNECCEELRRRKVKCVMGNHDWYMAAGVNCERSRSVNDCLEYQRSIISKENLEWVRSFKPIIVANGLNMVHGGWNNPIDEYLNIADLAYFDNVDGVFFASGHTHIQGVYEYGQKMYCNPGSVGQPRDGDNRAAFATFDGNKFNLYRVDYDYEEVGKLMEKAGFNPYYYGCLRDGAKRLHV